MPGPSPTPLGTDGFLGSANLYSAGSAVSSPLTFTTTADIPASTTDAPVALYVICQVAPLGYDMQPEENSGELYTIDDGLGNDYEPMPSQPSDGSKTYGFGSPTLVTYTGFDAGENEQPFPNVGGASFWVYSCVPAFDIPSGTTITVAFPGPGNDPEIVWVAATMLGWQYTDPAFPGFAARGVNTTNIDQGSGGTDPVSSWNLGSVVGGTDHAAFALVSCWDCPGSLVAPDHTCSGDVIDGSQTVDDTGGQWTKVDSGGASSTSAYGGFVYSVFTIDGAVADLSAQFDQFEVTPFGGELTIGWISAFNMIFDYTPPTPPVGPVFNHRFRAGD